jgi:hypothetical protein
MTYRPRRGGPVPAPVPILSLDRCSKLESFKPLLLCPQNWAVLLQDDHPVGRLLDFGRC